MSEPDHQCLDDDLLSRRCRSRFPDGSSHWFIPQSCVTELLTPSRIREELEFKLQPGSAIDDGIVEYIYTSAKLLFCITLSARLCGNGLYEAMKTFHQGGLKDADLPISGKKYPELLTTDDVEITLTEHNLFKTGPWIKNARTCVDFTTNQWLYLAPVFASSSVTMDLEEDHILPFTEVGSIRKQGTFGNVYQVTIHASHQEVPLRKANGGLATHAIKELKASLHEDALEEDKQLHKDWELEAKALRDVKDLGHEHMIQVNAIIKKGQRQYFLFPWADRGSLQDYYTANMHPTVTNDLIHGILDQLLGLADAIHSLHNFNRNQGNHKESTESYRHGDLKPENILIFSDQTQELVGKWKIADMGLAKHHVAPTGVRGLQATSTRYGTRMYEPPEVVTRHKAARSRLYDIWSMGCIVLEMIIWLLYGYEELITFNESLKGSHLEVESPYWEKDNNGKAQVHHRVRTFMRLIRKDLESSRNQRNALGDLFEVVETKLLVVDLPPNRTTFYRKDEDHDTSPNINTPTGNTPSADNTSNLSRPTDSSRSELPTMTFTQPQDELLMDDSLSYQESLEGFRCTAKDLHNAIQSIMSECKMDKTYWDPGQRRKAIQALRNTSLSPNAARGQAGLEAPILSKNTVVPISAGLFAEPPGMIDLSKEWETPVDNVYAQDAFNGSPDLSKTVRASSALEKVARLCEKCQKMELWKPNFHVSETRAELEKLSSTCDFCRIRWNQCKRHEPISATVHFSKVDSTLRLNERYPPVLALCRPPGFEEVGHVPSIQIGLHQLEAAGSDSHVAIMRHWLDDCDHKHFSCKLIGNQPSLPTRLIYVGHRDLAAPVLKLIETKNLQRMVHYLALSHPWGDGPFYCTYPDNLEQHKRGIDMEALPATFRDSVEITRKLGYDYLWIDSICIIQGPDGDFRQESKQMENVFSQAFCVLAASSATGQQSGFLRSRDGARRLGESRHTVRLPLNGENPLYVCDSIERFDKDVLESGLNQRGWVLQERALARRTIYFTKTQTYFECGAGVRCETFTKMTNKLASFLGDPAFPKIAFESTRGGKILLCQDLYKQYSRLQFSKQQDRPDAIAGLEKRLIETLNVHGGFGVFDDPKHPGLLRRSLLWHRAVAECDSLEAINFASRTCPPTWSWMMYKGGIEYLGELPFDEVEWDRDDVLSPWESAQAKWHSSDDTSSSLGLSVHARNFTWGMPALREEAMMILDIPARTDGLDPLMKCVVLGRLRGPPRKAYDTKHFVLFVTESKRRTAGRRRVLTRLGAGYMPGSWINLDEPGSLAELH